MTLATIVVPTHDHHETLPLAVRSCLAQTVADVEVLIVGDGATPEVRATAGELVAADPRVRFMDLPKGAHHGETHRDRAVREATSNAIFYVCDDDLLLPRHVENLLPLLESNDLVQCRNGYVDTSGTLVLYPTDLALPEAVGWHLRTPRRNAISLTGTAHRRDSYLGLDEGWTTTPAGEWPDHYMWKKLLRREGARAATHPDMTAVQLPTSAGRRRVGQQERAAELRVWAERLQRDDAHSWLQGLVAEVTSSQLDRTHRAHTDAVIDLRQERRLREEELVRHERERARHRVTTASLTAARSREAAAHARLRDIEASRSWRLTAPLRRVGRALRRLRP